MFALLWDASHIWGLLLYRAALASGAPLRLVTAAGVASGELDRGGYSLLLVPGGFAGKKAQRLGKAGIAGARAFVAAGGSYLGLCGGAGLGLTGGGLSLCPFGRAAFASRVEHFASGHIHVAATTSELVPGDLPDRPRVPVWWPSGFAEVPGPVTVLARYAEPAADFMMADLPVGALGGETLDSWRDLYGVDLSGSFLAGRPCLAAGEHGRGRYVLSHAHLETPGSPEANRWFAHLLAVLSGHGLSSGAEGFTVPDWDIAAQQRRWDDPALSRAMDACDGLIALGKEHFLLFERTPWLFGWRRGLPGAALNSLRAMLAEALSREPSDRAVSYWRAGQDDFSLALDRFLEGARGYFLAERLAMSLSASDPGAVPAKCLKETRGALFGPMPAGGGMIGALLDVLEKLLYLVLNKS